MARSRRDPCGFHQRIFPSSRIVPDDLQGFDGQNSSVANHIKPTLLFPIPNREMSDLAFGHRAAIPERWSPLSTHQGQCEIVKLDCAAPVRDQRRYHRVVAVTARPPHDANVEPFLVTRRRCHTNSRRGTRYESPMCNLSYHCHRFPAEVIRYAVWLYFRFPLSFRDVEDLLFGLAYARKLRRSHPPADTSWHLDEVFVLINGRTMYLWRAVDL